VTVLGLKDELDVVIEHATAMLAEAAAKRPVHLGRSGDLARIVSLLSDARGTADGILFMWGEQK
jgi:hypothetical protein